MFLKYLAIEGFKSFPERNSLEMSPGACVLVGANGTGKSNVTDAVSWVLGEDDLAALRCTSQDELIFAGSPELQSLDTARVSLTSIFHQGSLQEPAIGSDRCRQIRR